MTHDELLAYINKEINQEFNLGLTAMAEVIKQAIEKELG